MQRAIVTGADGFLGGHLVRGLRQHGVHVTGLARSPGPDVPYLAMGGAPWCVSCLARIIETAEPDVVFHLVGGVVGSEAELEQSNLGVATSSNAGPRGGPGAPAAGLLRQRRGVRRSHYRRSAGMRECDLCAGRRLWRSQARPDECCPGVRRKLPERRC